MKEGSTIYKLTPQEQRKAALGMGQDRSGTKPFTRFLVASAEHRDAATHISSGQHHEAACLVDVLNELTSAMLTANRTAGARGIDSAWTR